MTSELLPILVIAFIGWVSLKQVASIARHRRHLEIARYGEVSEGRVVAIQRPFLLDSCVRLYFDYVPVGSERPIRACHIAPRVGAELRSSIPHMGSSVSVSYLPHRPSQAVILGLVAS